MPFFALCGSTDSVVYGRALTSDILDRFPTRTSLTLSDLQAYLSEHAPDRRLSRLVAALRRGTVLRNLLDSVRSLMAGLGERPAGFSNTDSWKAVDLLHEFCPTCSYTSQGPALSVISRIHRTWQSDGAANSGSKPDFDEPVPTVSTDILPEVTFAVRGIVNYSGRLGHSEVKADIDVGVPADEIVTHRGTPGLLLTIAVGEDGDLYIRPTLYPTAKDHVNPDSPDEAVFFLTSRSGPLYRCRADAFADFVNRLPTAPTAVAFLGHSWSVWRFRDPNNTVLRNAIIICFEPDLSESRLLTLLRASDLVEKR
jgi:hypothetical protein